MLPHFVNLLRHSWGSLVSATSTNTLGFILWTLSLTLVGLAATIAEKWWSLKREKTSPRPFRQALQESIWTSIFLISGVAGLVILAFAVSLVWTVYADHQNLASANVKLSKTNNQLAVDLEERKQNIHVNEPAYEHIKVLFGAFTSFRRAIGNRTPCEIRISAPIGSGGPSDPIIRQIADVATLSSGCGVFGPGDARMDPDVEKEAVTGMKPGFIVLHTKRDQPGSLAFYDAIASYLPLSRSYDDMPTPVQRGGPAVPTLIWFQFGKDVHWTR